MPLQMNQTWKNMAEVLIFQPVNNLPGKSWEKYAKRVFILLGCPISPVHDVESASGLRDSHRLSNISYLC